MLNKSTTYIHIHIYIPTYIHTCIHIYKVQGRRQVAELPTSQRVRGGERVTLWDHLCPVGAFQFGH
jgi:hypothetical protein